MHFPEPMPAFDVVAIDGPYYALANWQNRVFAIPPAMGSTTGSSTLRLITPTP